MEKNKQKLQQTMLKKEYIQIRL